MASDNPSVKVGRLALRHDGKFWNAYYALPDTMTDALLLGSIVMRFVVNNEQRKSAFIAFMPSSQFALMEATKKRAAKLEAKGQTVDFKELLRMEPDGGTTNIRNVSSKHWQRWLDVEHRCVVPFNSFREFNKAEGSDSWFALDEIRPLACVAGIWTNVP